MAPFVRVVEQFAAVLYAACAVGVLWSIRGMWLAWRERDRTLYALERETASARIGRGVLSALAFVGLGALVFFVARFVAPSLPAEQAPTPTPSGPLVTLTPSPTPFPTPTPSLTPTPNSSLDATALALTPIDTATP